MTPEQQQAFMAAIGNFSQRLKREEALPILAGWDPVIVLIDTETKQSLSLTLKGSDLANVAVGGADSVGDIVVEGDSATLLSIFDGSQSAAEALFDGRIVVTAEPENQMKLDALSFVIWDDE
jgi:SCP-2 sterol transfer family